MADTTCSHIQKSDKMKIGMRRGCLFCFTWLVLSVEVVAFPWSQPANSTGGDGLGCRISLDHVETHGDNRRFFFVTVQPIEKSKTSSSKQRPCNRRA